MHASISHLVMVNLYNVRSIVASYCLWIYALKLALHAPLHIIMVSSLTYMSVGLHFQMEPSYIFTEARVQGKGPGILDID